jgi:large subunit ribosomal protein L13
VRLTGNKLSQKMYHRHSGYTGGLTSISAGKMLEKTPEELIGRQMFKKLKVYCGADHPHQAQQPKELQV